LRAGLSSAKLATKLTNKPAHTHPTGTKSFFDFTVR